MPKLRFVAAGGINGGPMTPDYAAQSHGMRRFHGRRLDSAIGQPFMNARKGGMPDRHAVFVAHEGAEAIEEVDFSSPYRAEYLRHLKEGDLLPADQFTAQQAGVKFDSTLKGAAMWGEDKAAAETPPVPAAQLFADAQKARGAATSKPAAAPAAESKVAS